MMIMMMRTVADLSSAGGTERHMVRVLNINTTLVQAEIVAKINVSLPHNHSVLVDSAKKIETHFQTHSNKTNNDKMYAYLN